MRCRPGTAKARALAIPDQQCTAPDCVENVEQAEGGALHCIRDTSYKRYQSKRKTRGHAMQSLKMLGMATAIVLASSYADAATITGTVKGPDGAGLRGAFVQAREAKTKIMVSVLSDNQGRYKVENLPAGEYRLQIRAPGFRAEPRSGVNLAT